MKTTTIIAAAYYYCCSIQYLAVHSMRTTTFAKICSIWQRLTLNYHNSILHGILLSYLHGRNGVLFQIGPEITVWSIAPQTEKKKKICWNNFHSEITSKFHKQVIVVQLNVKLHGRKTSLKQSFNWQKVSQSTWINLCFLVKIYTNNLHFIYNF